MDPTTDLTSIGAAFNLISHEYRLFLDVQVKKNFCLWYMDPQGVIHNSWTSGIQSSLALEWPEIKLLLYSLTPYPRHTVGVLC